MRKILKLFLLSEFLFLFLFFGILTFFLFWSDVSLAFSSVQECIDYYCPKDKPCSEDYIKNTISPYCASQVGTQGTQTSTGWGLFRCEKKPCGPNEICNPLCAENIEGLINVIVNFIFWAALVIAPLMIIIAAFYFMTSASDPNRIKTAKNIILYTVIGLAIILFSKGLISVIRGVLG